MKVAKKFDEMLKKTFVNINKFANHDINKFILLLRKHRRNSIRHHYRKIRFL